MSCSGVLASLEGSQGRGHLVGLCLFLLGQLVGELVHGRTHSHGRSGGEGPLQVARQVLLQGLGHHALITRPGSMCMQVTMTTTRNLPEINNNLEAVVPLTLLSSPDLAAGVPQ